MRAALALALALGVAAPAAAAPLAVEVRSGRLLVGPVPGDAAPVDAAVTDAGGALRIEDRAGRGLAPGPGALAAGCAPAPGGLVCPPGAVAAVLLVGGSGADRLGVTAAVPAQVACGRGPDVVDGGPGLEVDPRTCEDVRGVPDPDPPRLLVQPAGPDRALIDCGEPCAVRMVLRAPASPLVRLVTGREGAVGLAGGAAVIPTAEDGPAAVPLAPGPAAARLLDGRGRVAADLVVVATDRAGNRAEVRVATGLGPRRPRALPLGRSVRGRALAALLPPGPASLLVVAGQHGDEGAGVEALRAALTRAGVDDLRAVVLPVANPDGLAAGTRANARDVDLNRNLPTGDWGTGRVRRPGPRPASEPETRALMRLVRLVRPRAIVTVHTPLALVEDEDGGALGRRLARLSGLPLRASVGYATPGSFGTWTRELGIPEVTLELAPGPPPARVVDALADLLRRG
ncbi:MAG: succinylglutamate desuccinylase/aspartoacylase family protein [Thermoleophilia bacterium]|nr:succinylglutamate desuccinylase/aspartoacylase family protein [Thermoleophilia bacterium]